MIFADFDADVAVLVIGMCILVVAGLLELLVTRKR